MNKWIKIGAVAAVIGGLGAMGGCEIVAVTALNMVETTRFHVDNETLFMRGEINSKTDTQFEAVIAANPQIKTLIECDVPGSLDDDTMIPLSYRVRELGLNTHLTSTSSVASGGTDLFLAGVERTIESGAYIGVHSWSDGMRDASEYPRSSPEHEANATYIRDMLGNDDFYWFTIYSAPANDIHQMSEAEIIQYGLITAPILTPQTGPTCPDF